MSCVAMSKNVLRGSRFCNDLTLYRERVARIKNGPAGVDGRRGGVAFVVECRMIQGYTSGRKDSGHDGSR